MSKLNYMSKKCKQNNFHCPYHACMSDGCQFQMMDPKHRQWLRLCAPDIRNTAAGQVLFVKYSQADRCEKCYLSNYKEVCEKIDCKTNERADMLTGYYRLYNAAKPLEFAVPKPTRLMMILIAAVVLFASCTVSLKVSVGQPQEQVETASDSTQVKQYNWF